MFTAITGTNWGDEGKGRIVDLLSRDYNIVVRYQGGSNASHTIIANNGKFVLNLLPSGILHKETINVMGPGMVINLAHLHKECATLKERGVLISPENLKINSRAVIYMPYHRLLDTLEENLLGKNPYPGAHYGIASAYGDKYTGKALHMGDLCRLAENKERIKNIVAFKNLVLEKVYGATPFDFDKIWEELIFYAEEFSPYICDTALYLAQAAQKGKDILFEAHLGALQDIDSGVFPQAFCNTVAAYAPVGAGVPSLKLDNSLGVTKAYSACSGEGPLVSEWFGKAADELREAGGEYNVATGLPYRVGSFDIVATKYGCSLQGAGRMALTMLDALSYLDEIPVCVAYEIDGRQVTEFPRGEALCRAKPVLKTLKGWKQDITFARSKSELPPEALAYIEFIEQGIGCRIKYVSVGPERDACVHM